MSVYLKDDVTAAERARHRSGACAGRRRGGARIRVEEPRRWRASSRPSAISPPRWTALAATRCPRRSKCGCAAGPGRERRRRRAGGAAAARWPAWPTSATTGNGSMRAAVGDRRGPGHRAGARRRADACRGADRRQRRPARALRPARRNRNHAAGRRARCLRARTIRHGRGAAGRHRRAGRAAGAGGGVLWLCGRGI